MADAVTAILERMVPELEELQERGIFTPVSGPALRYGQAANSTHHTALSPTHPGRGEIDCKKAE